LNQYRLTFNLFIDPPIPKPNSILIPQQPIINEVTSSGQLLNIKRPKMTPIPTNNMNLRPAPINDNNNKTDDDRKRQVRESNRAAARRCRERRRQYTEQLERSLDQCKLELKQITEKLSLAERENTQLRAIVTETKLFHPTSRLSSNESIVDFANVISATNSMDLHPESTSGSTLQRNYINRNTR
jgi:septal ring factor EnvC (AmiA/AmiB activator)